jgi:hypothetical protein
MNIQLNLTIAEVNAVLQTLGQLPTNSGVYPLLVKIKTQAEEQIPEDQKATPENTQE